MTWEFIGIVTKNIGESIKSLGILVKKRNFYKDFSLFLLPFVK